MATLERKASVQNRFEQIEEICSNRRNMLFLSYCLTLEAHWEILDAPENIKIGLSEGCKRFLGGC